jgi:hypothetical protein
MITKGQLMEQSGNIENFNHFNLLESIRSGDDMEAIYLSHKFNDHNLRLMDVKQ